MMRLWIVSLAALWVASASATARAQFDHGRSTGRAAASPFRESARPKPCPTVAKIEVRMQGKAEITDDALVKYQATHRRLTEALGKAQAGKPAGQRTAR